MNKEFTEEKQRYLMYMARANTLKILEDGTVAKYNCDGTKLEIDSRVFDYDEDLYPDSTIIAWQPLPEV